MHVGLWGTKLCFELFLGTTAPVTTPSNVDLPSSTPECILLFEVWDRSGTMPCMRGSALVSDLLCGVERPTDLMCGVECP